jgi:quercetin dioxygenase-like cupin family protein
MSFSQDGYALGEGQGEGIWFLNTLMTVKAGTDQTRGAFTLIEQVCPPGFATPPHIHRSEEEGFYVLDGELTVTCGGKTWTVVPGGFVLLPRGIAHGFTVSPTGPAKLLQITSPARFERFAAELGEPARQPTLPPPSPPDVAKLMALMAKFDYEIAGPPPER